MSSSSRSTTVWTVAGVTLLSGFLAYAVYFDYKRRNDTDFRKKLRKEKKRVNKTLAQSKDAESAAADSLITPEALKNALDQVKNEEGPKSPEERESYFMTQVGMGEQLSLQGPTFHLPAAVCFFKALRVYPAPVELIMIYQKTVPEPIFKIVMDMTNLDVTDRIQGYYERFPPKSLNVAIEEQPGNPLVKVVILTKDVAAGEVIYKEHPVVTTLDPDIQSAGTHCTHCFRSIQPDLSLKLPSDADPLPSRFCSKACLIANKVQSHTILFSLDSPIPEELSVSLPIPEEALQARKEAQERYAAYIKNEGRTSPLLAARFIARQLAAETNKLAGGSGAGGGGSMSSTGDGAKTNKLPGVEDDYTDTDDAGYGLADHLERLKALDLSSTPPSEEELNLLVGVLKHAIPGLDQFVDDERYAIMVGKMRYNAYGVCFGGGRDDRPAPNVPVEDTERTRTPYGTSRQIGSAIYTLSSYLPHSCIPSARVSFQAGTAELHVVANRDLKKGDEITVAWVDVVQRVASGESVAECRRRRRFELARGWKFACGCKRCEDETNLGEEIKQESVTQEVKEEEEEEDTTIRVGDISNGAIPKVEGEPETASKEAEPVDETAAIDPEPSPVNEGEGGDVAQTVVEET